MTRHITVGMHECLINACYLVGEYSRTPRIEPQYRDPRRTTRAGAQDEFGVYLVEG